MTLNTVPTVLGTLRLISDSPNWLYNEFQQVGTDFENAAQVEAYDRNQISSSVEEEQELMTQLGISAGHAIIEFGCGTGTFAIQAALVGAYVYAVDVSQAMLQYAQQKAQKAGVLDNIEMKLNVV
jgi:cyclopropane fatty-acyl-phospholipid synthase-like methyltransferase